jgi:hypothetical protein
MEVPMVVVVVEQLSAEAQPVAIHKVLVVAMVPFVSFGRGVYADSHQPV